VIKTGIFIPQGILKKGEKKRLALLICFVIFTGKKNNSFNEKDFISQSIIFTFAFTEKECNNTVFPSSKK
jgi:hypothetical protein